MVLVFDRGTANAGTVVVDPCFGASRSRSRAYILWDATRQTLTGIIGWSDIAVSDRLIDFAGLFHWGGEAFIEAILSRYDGPVDGAALSRARFLAVCRGDADVAFGLETGRREYI